MWKMVVAVLSPLACLLFGWVKGSSSRKKLDEAKAGKVAAESRAVKAEKEESAVSAAASLSTTAREAVKDSDLSAEEMESQLEDASNRGDLDMAIRIARQQAERAREFAEKVKELEG